MQKIIRDLKQQASELLHAAQLIESVYKVSGRIGRPVGSVKGHSRYKLSRAGRQRIAIAQRKRWAKIHAKIHVMKGGRVA